eukprot:c27476_g1_i1 orf=196-411(+)
MLFLLQEMIHLSFIVDLCIFVLEPTFTVPPCSGWVELFQSSTVGGGREPQPSQLVKEHVCPSQNLGCFKPS